MRGAVLAYGDAGVGADDLHIQMRIRQRIADLLKCAARREHGEGIDKYDFSAGGHTSGDAYHVGLCNAHVPGALRIQRAELFRPGAALKVRIQHKDPGIGADFSQRLAISRSGRDLIHNAPPPFQPRQPERPARQQPFHTVPYWGRFRATPYRFP